MAEKKTKREKAEHAGKAAMKASAGDYVGAGVEVVEGFGYEIKKFITIILAIIIIPIIMIVAVFDTLPGLIISNFSETIGNALYVTEDKISEWSVKKANKAIINTFEDIEKEVANEIIKEIKDGYIPNWNSNVNNYWNGNTPSQTLNGMSGINREKDTQNLIGWLRYQEEHGEMYTMLRFKNVMAKEINLDSIYFLCAYSVWHQNHNLADDYANDDNDGYVETDDKEKRWTSFDTDGLKKFIRNNRYTLLSADFSYSDEYRVQKYGIEGDDGSFTYEYINIPIKVLNVTLDIANKRDIDNLFCLTAEQKEEVELYCELAKALFETAYEGSTSDLNCTFEPMSKVVKRVFGIPADGKTEIFKKIDSIPYFLSDIYLEKSNTKRFDGDYQSILDQMNEDWEKAHPPKSETLGYPTKYRTLSADYPYYPSGSPHTGIDFPCPIGTEVYASASGTVVVSVELTTSYGKYIVIKHEINGEKLYTLYGHNSQLLVKTGDKVNKGDLIAYSGNSGNSTGPHCHFSVLTSWLFRNYVDPKDYLTED